MSLLFYSLQSIANPLFLASLAQVRQDRRALFTVGLVYRVLLLVVTKVPIVPHFVPYAHVHRWQFMLLVFAPEFSHRILPLVLHVLKSFVSSPLLAERELVIARSKSSRNGRMVTACCSQRVLMYGQSAPVTRRTVVRLRIPGNVARVAQTPSG